MASAMKGMSQGIVIKRVKGGTSLDWVIRDVNLPCLPSGGGGHLFNKLYM